MKKLYIHMQGYLLGRALEKGVDEEEEVLDRLAMLNEERNKKERGITEGERQGL